MKTDVLASILDGQKGVRRDGGAYLIEEHASATVFAGAGSEVITVPRITRFDLGREIVALTTSKGERFFFPYELVLGLKLEESEEAGRRPPGGAGFR